MATRASAGSSLRDRRMEPMLAGSKVFGFGRLGAFCFLAATTAGCSLERFAADRLGSLLGSGGSAWGAEEDPELAAAALPFALKTLESLVAVSPRNPELRLGACRGFVTYALGFVAAEADSLAPSDFERAQQIRQRALRLLLRGRNHCFTGIERLHPRLARGLRAGRAEGLEACRKADVPWLYWTAAAMGGAVSLGSDQPELLVDLPVVRALLYRALALEPSFERGAVHELFVVLDSLPESLGGSEERARWHYEEALRLAGGQRASPYVTWAVQVALPRQDRQGFESALRAALAVEPREGSPDRLGNELAKRRARQLLERAEELFF